MAKISQPVFKIIKGRWPEVVLILGIGILTAVSGYFPLVETPDSAEAAFPPPHQIIFFAIGAIMTWGFLRTVCLDSLSCRQPWELFKTGLHFLLRMMGFGLLFGLALLGLLMFLCEIASQFAFVKSALTNAPNQMAWPYSLCFMAAMLILMKPYLLMPAVIIAMDCKVIDSFKALRLFEFRRAAGLIILFCGQLLLMLAGLVLKSQSLQAYIGMALITVLANFLMLVVSIKAIKLVCSVDVAAAQENKNSRISES